MKFRKKPVVIEAVHLIPDNWKACIEFIGADFASGDGPLCCLGIRTLEGVLTASRGDWIIRGVKGEHYACKPDIFAATYESADRATPPAAPAAATDLSEHVAVLRGAMRWMRKEVNELSLRGEPSSAASLLTDYADRALEAIQAALAAAASAAVTVTDAQVDAAQAEWKRAVYDEPPADGDVHRQAWKRAIAAAAAAEPVEGKS